MGRRGLRDRKSRERENIELCFVYQRKKEARLRLSGLGPKRRFSADARYAGFMGGIDIRKFAEDRLWCI